MQISIIVPDRTVYVDGFAVELPALDWAKFDGEKNNPWDDISAVQFDTERKSGHVEYKTVATKQTARADMTPPNWLIGEADFANNFAWVLPIYQAERERVEAAEAARKEAEAKAAETAAAKAESDRRAAIERASLPRDESAAPVEPVASKDELEALQKQLAALQASNELLAQRVAANEEAAIKTLGGG